MKPTLNIPMPATFVDRVPAAVSTDRLIGMLDEPSFDDRLRQLGPDDEAAAKQDKAREAAEQFVSFGLILPLMKMAREDPFKTPLFHGGRAEEIFGAQLDQTLADRIGPTAARSLVDSVYRRFTDAPSPDAQINRHG